jgi:hypothetical protein
LCCFLFLSNLLFVLVRKKTVGESKVLGAIPVWNSESWSLRLYLVLHLYFSFCFFELEVLSIKYVDSSREVNSGRMRVVTKETGKNCTFG